MFIVDLVLVCALTQQPQPAPALPPDHQVALVFSPTETRLMRLDDARRAYRRLSARKRLNDEDSRLHAALTIALGTLPDAERLSALGLPGTRERLDWEIRRGVRKAVQGREP